MNDKEKPYITVKDFSVSGESFTLVFDDNRQILKTTPTPPLASLPKYYESTDYISHTDSSRSIFEKTYQFVKRQAIRNKIKLITKYVKTGKLLDIGAGTADFLVQAKKKHWEVEGIEPNSAARQLAQKKGITLLENSKPIKDNSFDVITMWHVLEHVPDLNYQLTELKRICKPNGIIVIAVPNFNSYDAKYYKQFWAAYDVPRHLWHFSKSGIKKLFLDYAIKLIKVKPMWFDSFYVSLLSEKYKSGKMNAVKGFFIGMMSNCIGLRKKEYSSHIYVFKSE